MFLLITSSNPSPMFRAKTIEMTPKTSKNLLNKNDTKILILYSRFCCPPFFQKKLTTFSGTFNCPLPPPHLGQGSWLRLVQRLALEAESRALRQLRSQLHGELRTLKAAKAQAGRRSWGWVFWIRSRDFLTWFCLDLRYLAGIDEVLWKL